MRILVVEDEGGIMLPGGQETEVREVVRFRDVDVQACPFGSVSLRDLERALSEGEER